jgi:hypothetical protein
MVRGLSQRPNLTGGPAATWDFRRSIKEEEEEVFQIYHNILQRNIAHISPLSTHKNHPYSVKSKSLLDITTWLKCCSY